MELLDILFRLNARGKRVTSTLGWIVIVLVIFTTSALALAGRQWWNTTRLIEPLVTALPETIQPAGVGWALSSQVLPGGTQVYSADQETQRQVLVAFLDGWNALAFLNEFPTKTDAASILNKHFWPDGPAYRGAQSTIAAARISNRYWRREIVGAYLVRNVVEFEQSGVEAKFSIFFPSDRVRSQLIDLRSGKVITSSAQDLPFRITMRYDTAQKGWLIYEAIIQK